MGFNANGITATSVASAGTTDIVTITIPSRAEVLVCELANANSYNLDALQVQMKAHPLAAFVTMASAAADFTTALKPPVLAASGDLTVLTKDTSGMLMLDVRSVHQVKLVGSANGGASIVTVRWSC